MAELELFPKSVHYIVLKNHFDNVNVAESLVQKAKDNVTAQKYNLCKAIAEHFNLQPDEIEISNSFCVKAQYCVVKRNEPQDEICLFCGNILNDIFT